MKSTSVVAFNVSQTTPHEALVAAYTAGYKKKMPRPICSQCDLAGHTSNKCYKIHGYPHGNKSRQHNQFQAPVTEKSNQQWPPRKENVANMVLQDKGGISMHNQHGFHLGTVTKEHVYQLLNVLSTQHTPLSDGTDSTSKPQPHIIAHTISDHPPSSNSTNSHFVCRRRTILRF